MHIYLKECLALLYLASIARSINVIDPDDDDRGGEANWGRCPWIRNRLKNGKVKMRSRGRMAKFSCNPGYQLAGKRFITCIRGQWNNPFPYCVASGCYQLPVPKNAMVTEMLEGAHLVYTCMPGYFIRGRPNLYCDGERWSDAPPICETPVQAPATACHFEDPDLCGWSHDMTRDFVWKRNQFGTPSGHVGTGPYYDHTYGRGKGGFYLYLEASYPRKENATCQIFSPVYPRQFSPGCFTFWYHMYGATIGGLRVYFKQESQLLEEISPIWEKFGDQGNQWLRGKINISKVDENFQLVIEGIRGSNYVGDTAIDDVVLWASDCNADHLLNATSVETSLDSCRGRCRELNVGEECECMDGCTFNNTCCHDYEKICTSGGESSIWDSETAPDFIVTEYVNTVSDSQKTTQIITKTPTEYPETSTKAYKLSTNLYDTEKTLAQYISTSVMPEQKDVETTTSSPSTKSQIIISPLLPITSAPTPTAASVKTSIPTWTNTMTQSLTNHSATVYTTKLSTSVVTALTTSSMALLTTLTDAHTTIVTSPPMTTTMRIPSPKSSQKTKVPKTTVTPLTETFLTKKPQFITTIFPRTTNRILTTIRTTTNTLPEPSISASDHTTITVLDTSNPPSTIMTTLLPTTTTKKIFSGKFPPKAKHTTTRSTVSTELTTTKATSTTETTSTTPKTQPTTSKHTTLTTRASTRMVTERKTEKEKTTALPTTATTYQTHSEMQPTHSAEPTRAVNLDQKTDMQPTNREEAKPIQVLPKSSAKSQETSSSSMAVVSVCIVVGAALICVAAFVVYRRLLRKQNKHSDYSEIRFLSQNEVLEFSDVQD